MMATENIGMIPSSTTGLVHISGDKLLGVLSAGEHVITDDAPKADTDAANEGYVDNHDIKAGDTVTGTINMDGIRVTGLPTNLSEIESGAVSYK